LVPLEPQDSQELKEISVKLDLPVFKVLKEPQGLPVLLEQLDPLDLLVSPDLKEFKDHLEFKDLLV